MIKNRHLFLLVKIICIIIIMQTQTKASNQWDYNLPNPARLTKFVVWTLAVFSANFDGLSIKKTKLKYSKFDGFNIEKSEFKPSKIACIKLRKKENFPEYIKHLKNTESKSPDKLIKDAFVLREKGYHEESHHLMEIAAEKGNPYAQLNAGLNYFYGCGTTKNTLMAIIWIEYAAQAKDYIPRADAYLAWFYQHGIEVDRNITEAILLYTRAANANDPKAINELNSILHPLQSKSI